MTFDNLTMPARLLWTLMFLKKCSTEEASAARAGVHEDTFRDCAWCVLTVISNVEFAIILTTSTQIATVTLCY